jgi:hypothetical protein
MAGRDAEAAEVLRTAERIFEQKGAPALVARARVAREALEAH